MSLQGLGAVAQGINQGINLAQRDDLLTEQKAQREQENAFRQDIRSQWKLQNQRANDAADRAETLRQADAAIPTIGSDLTKTTDLRDAVLPGAKAITVDDDGMPSATAIPALQTTTRKFNDADAARAMATNRQAAGDAAGALAMRQQAEKLSMQQARAEIARLDASSAGMPLQDYVNALADLGRRDESPIDVRPTKVNPDGTVGVTVFNRNTSHEMPLTIKDAAHAREVAMSHFNPEGYEAWKQKQAESAARIAEKRAEHPVTSVAGGYVENDTRKFVRTAAGGTGTGASDGGSGKGKKPADPSLLNGLDIESAYKLATKLVDSQDGAERLTPQQRAQKIHAYVMEQQKAHVDGAAAQVFVNQAEGILRRAASNPKLYASEYEKVRAQPGSDAVLAELARRGITAPKVESKPKEAAPPAPAAQPQQTAGAAPPALPKLTEPRGMFRPHVVSAAQGAADAVASWWSKPRVTVRDIRALEGRIEQAKGGGQALTPKETADARLAGLIR